MDLQKISSFNSWWIHSEFDIKESSLKKRYVFWQAVEYLDKNFIISVSWQRRVWKSTILMQLVEHLLHKYMLNPKKIFFYRFSKTDNNLKDILDYFFYEVCKEKNKWPSYVFLDELQFVNDWQEILKYWFDLNKDIHFIVTWSTSLYYYGYTKESLAGRILELDMNPMLFDEYVYLKYPNYIPVNMKKIYNIDTFVEIIEKYSQSLLLYKHEFGNYLIQWELPQIINETDYWFVHKYIWESILDKILWYDIDLFQIAKKEEFWKLFKHLAVYAWNRINKSNISKDFSISLPTLKKYLSILEKLFLSFEIQNFLRSPKSQEKSFNKFYFRSINILLHNLQIQNFDNILFADIKWFIFENYIANLLYYIFGKNIHYFNKNDFEVDFIINIWKQILPIEVKCKSQIVKKNYNSLLTYMKKNNCDKWLVFYRWENDKMVYNWKEIYLIGL